MTTWNHMVDAAERDAVRASLPSLYCKWCGMEIVEGDDYLVYEDEPYCSALCVVDQLITDELVRTELRGEEAWLDD